MAKVINDLSPVPQSIDECADHVAFFSGYDRPRYYNHETKSSGRLGLDDWSSPEYKPSGIVVGSAVVLSESPITGTLHSVEGTSKIILGSTAITANDQYNGFLVRNRDRDMSDFVEDTVEGVNRKSITILTETPGSAGDLIEILNPAGDSSVDKTAIEIAGSIVKLANGEITSSGQFNGQLAVNTATKMAGKIKNTYFLNTVVAGTDSFTLAYPPTIQDNYTLDPDEADTITLHKGFTAAPSPEYTIGSGYSFPYSVPEAVVGRWAYNKTTGFYGKILTVTPGSTTILDGYDRYNRPIYKTLNYTAITFSNMVIKSGDKIVIYTALNPYIETTTVASSTILPGGFRKVVPANTSLITFNNEYVTTSTDVYLIQNTTKGTLSTISSSLANEGASNTTEAHIELETPAVGWQTGAVKIYATTIFTSPHTVSGQSTASNISDILPDSIAKQYKILYSKSSLIASDDEYNGMFLYNKTRNAVSWIIDTAVSESTDNYLVFNTLLSGSTAKYWQAPDAIDIIGQPKIGLENGRYYSIKVVPANRDIAQSGFPVIGSATLPSMPIAPTYDQREIVFVIPTHDQMRSVFCGDCYSSSTTTMQIESADWTTSEFIGATLFNVESGRSTRIISNTVDTLTFVAVSTFAISAGDRFQIQKSECTDRFIFASSGATQEEAISGDFYFQDVIKDNTSTSYTMKTFAIGDLFLGDNYQPPNAAVCHTVGDVLFSGGGIDTSGAGLARVNRDKETKTGASFSVITDTFEDAGTQRVVRIEVGTPFSAIYKNSIVSITGASNTNNNISKTSVIRVGSRDTLLKTSSWNGSGYLAVSQLTGTEEVISSNGTSIPSIAAGRINFTAGTCYDLVLSNGSKYPLTEGAGLICYDISGNGYDGNATGITATALWTGQVPQYAPIVMNPYTTALELVASDHDVVGFNGPNANEFGIDCWIITRDYFGGSQSIYDSNPFSIRLTGTGEVLVSFSGNGTITSEDDCWSHDTLNHLAIKYNSTTGAGSIWVNGVDVTLANTTTATYPVMTGAAAEIASGQGLNADIFRFRVWEVDFDVAAAYVLGSLDDTIEIPKDDFKPWISSGTIFVNATGDLDGIIRYGASFKKIPSKQADPTQTVLNTPVSNPPEQIKQWFEILNSSGINYNNDTTAVIEMVPNVVEGVLAGFSEGMIDAKISFDDDASGAYQIAWVNHIEQRLGLYREYIGTNSSYTPRYTIKSSNNLSYSDYKNPHRWRAESVIEISDDIKALSSIGKNLLAFCKRSIWRISTLELGYAPQMITNSIYFDAPRSICSNGQVVAFFDGEGFSITDGVSVRSMTSIKSRDYLRGINKDRASQICGIYNPSESRFEFYFPMGSEEQNNYGLYISEGTYNNVPISRPDSSVVFSGYEGGAFCIYHGTSGSYENGEATIWSHKEDTDGLNGTEYSSTVVAISDNVILVHSSAAIDWADGDVVLIYPAGSGSYQQCIIKTVTENPDPEVGVKEYELEFSDSYNLSGVSAGDSVLYGAIPFDYGIKWDDFQSPQFLKRVRELHLDLIGMTGKIYVDHYKDLNETPVQNDVKDVTPLESKLVFRFRQGTAYIYGFRLRGWSVTKFKINAFERIFSPIV
jgi:hypothetical protein